MFGQASYGNIINTGFCNRHQVFVVHSTGSFQLASDAGLVANQTDRFLHVVQCKIIQHDNVGSRLQCFLQFTKGFDFHFHRLARRLLSGALHRNADTSTSRDVVFLDQESIVKSEAMIETSANSDSVFLCTAQTGNGFAGVDYCAPDAPAGVFIDDRDLAERWPRPERYYLVAEGPQVPRIEKLVGKTALRTVAASGGKFLFTNK